MKHDSTENLPKRLGRYVLVGIALFSVAIGGCTMAKTTAEATSEIDHEATGETEDAPSVRLPSLRLSRRAVEPIDSLMADREADRVAVLGTVTQRAAILDGWLYEVEDKTGRLWVLTERSEPEVGAIATVEGIVRYEAIVVGEIDAGSVYLEEQAYEEQMQESN